MTTPATDEEIDILRQRVGWGSMTGYAALARVLARLDAEKARADAAEKDAARLDWLNNVVEGSAVSSCFEVDGGVHLTIESVCGAVAAYRNKDNLRAAIDAAMKASQP